MSLLEDVFLEDEAGEAQELECVIEGDDYDDRPISPNNEENDDEAEEDKRRVDPSQTKNKRVVRNPRFILNPARLTGPRGIRVIPDHFKDFKFKGKGHEKEDLDLVLKKLEHWAYRLYPKFEFKDCLKKIETLGKKRSVMVHLHKIRLDMITSEETVVQKDSSDDEAPMPEEDEFDKLLQQQIELARSTPAPGSVKKPSSVPRIDHSKLMPKVAASPSISEEQKERMLRNKKLAEERRLEQLKKDNNRVASTHKSNIAIDIAGVTRITDATTPVKNNNSNVIDSSDEEVKDTNVNFVGVTRLTDNDASRKHNRFNVLDSSDEEETNINSSVIVDVHSHISLSPNRNSVVILEQDKKNANKNNDTNKIIESLSKDTQQAYCKDSFEDDSNAHVISIVDINKSENVVEECDENNSEIISAVDTNVYDKCIEQNALVSASIGIETISQAIDATDIEKNNELKNNDNPSRESTTHAIETIENNGNVVNKECHEETEMELPNSSDKISPITALNKENIENFIGSEIMDVDFDDDF
ncbi:hypothetical protein ACJJTC_004188 [Scirpophaga incertulas]